MSEENIIIWTVTAMGVAVAIIQGIRAVLRDHLRTKNNKASSEQTEAISLDTHSPIKSSVEETGCNHFVRFENIFLLLFAVAFGVVIAGFTMPFYGSLLLLWGAFRQNFLSFYFLRNGFFSENTVKERPKSISFYCLAGLMLGISTLAVCAMSNVSGVNIRCCEDIEFQIVFRRWWQGSPLSLIFFLISLLLACAGFCMSFLYTQTTKLFERTVGRVIRWVRAGS